MSPPARCRRNATVYRRGGCAARGAWFEVAKLRSLQPLPLSSSSAGPSDISGCSEVAGHLSFHRLLPVR
jgi:hypothetical protein